MIKTSAMFSAHAIHVLHVVLRDTLIFLVVLFIALFAWLKYGIHSDRLILGKFVVDGLYIKLDKKLTLQADKIIIPKPKKKPSFDNIDETFDKIKYLFTYFDYIELKEIDFNNNKLKFLFTDNILYISSNDYEIAGKIERQGKKLIADVSLFYLKKEKINIVGKLKYFLNKDRLETEGKFEAYNITGNFAAFKDNNDISFAVKSDTFHDLKTVTAKLPLNDIVKSWIADKIVAEKYKLDSFVGKAKIVDKALKVDIDSLRGQATLNNVKIRFKDELDPVLANEVKLMYKKRALYFDLKDPVYKDRKLDGSKVAITNIKKGNIPLLHLDLHVKSKLDAVVQDILKAYKLNIPITQKDSRSKVWLKLLIPLTGPDKKMDIYVKVHLGKGNMYLKNLKLPVQSGEATFHKGVLVLKSVKLRSAWFEATVGGKVYTDTDEEKADLSVNAKRIELGEGKKKKFMLKNRKIPLTVYYGKKRSVLLPSLGIKAVQNKNGTQIKVNDLTKIIPFLKQMPIELNGGHLTLDTKDFERYTFKGEIIQKSCYLYGRKHKVCFTKIPCFGSVDQKDVDFYAFGKRLHYNSKNSLVSVSNLNIDLQSLIESRQRMQKGKAESGKTGKLVIKGDKSNLRYDKYTLVMDSYRADIYVANGNIKARGVLGKDVAHFTKKGNYISIEALRIHDRMLHPLINFDGLHDGRYTIKISGIPGKRMKGEILLNGGVLRSFKAYNKTRNFIKNNKNLSQIKDPGLTAKGFRIKEGKIVYRIVKNKVIFDSIYVKGDTATIVGKGTLNISTKKLNIEMAVQTVRELGKIVGSVPLLGYILMGEDNSITFGLKLSGTLDNPKVEMSAAKEILSLPFDLIKRTLQSPAHIINQPSKPKKKPLLNLKKPEIFNKVSP